MSYYFRVHIFGNAVFVSCVFAPTANQTKRVKLKHHTQTVIRVRSCLTLSLFVSRKALPCLSFCDDESTGLYVQHNSHIGINKFTIHFPVCPVAVVVSSRTHIIKRNPHHNFLALSSSVHQHIAFIFSAAVLLNFLRFLLGVRVCGYMYNPYKTQYKTYM